MHNTEGTEENGTSVVSVKRLKKPQFTIHYYHQKERQNMEESIRTYGIRRR